MLRCPNSFAGVPLSHTPTRAPLLLLCCTLLISSPNVDLNMPRKPSAEVARAVLSVVVDDVTFSQAARRHGVPVGSVKAAVWRWREARGLNGPPTTQQASDAPIPQQLRKQPRPPVGDGRNPNPSLMLPCGLSSPATRSSPPLLPPLDCRPSTRGRMCGTRLFCRTGRCASIWT